MKRKATRQKPSMTWADAQAEMSRIIREGAGEIVTNPPDKAGLVEINYFGWHIRRERVATYAAAVRRANEIRCDFLAAATAEVFEAELRKTGGDELAALSLMGVAFHDDRGDGLIYVPAFRAYGRMEAWKAAAAAVGITETKVRAA